jgi:uncharacterized membrane protein HdeD (DUF308 family)
MKHDARPGQSLTVLGVILVILGILAAALPLVTSFTITYILGFSIFVSGIAYCVNAFYNKRWSGFFASILLGTISLIAGALLIMYPVLGMYTITMLLAIFFIAQGVFKFIFALYLPKEVSKFWVIINALVCIILGILIWKALPASPLILGLLVSIDLILAGISMFLLKGRAEHERYE